MPALIQLRARPDTLYLSRGRTVLACGLDGDITSETHGLFVHETRVLSRHRLLVDGTPPRAVTLSNVQQFSWLGYYATAALGVPTGPPDEGSGQLAPLSQQTLEVRVSRVVGEGLHEDLDLTSFADRRIEFELAIELDADFGDLVEAGRERRRVGRITTHDRHDTGRWARDYRFLAEHVFDVEGEAGTARLDRSVTLRIDRSDSAPDQRDGLVRFRIALDPGATWHACLIAEATVDGVPLAAPGPCRALGSEPDQPPASPYLAAATRFSTPESATMSQVVVAALEQAKADLDALRLSDLDHGPDAWTMAAGLPLFVALFGRDTLTASWQAAMTGPEMMRGTLLELARWQGRTENAWRDEQPGRMLHEAHTGPLEALNYNPRARSYSSITTSAFYAVTLSELWHWTADRPLVERLVPTALAALEWLDTCRTVGAEGFHSYQTRSAAGVTHQAWKDSADAIVDEDGRQIAPPIATCEEQAFAYAAKLMLAEVLWWIDRKDDAKRLFREARELKARFNDRFWMADRGFFAIGLDAQGHRISAITSNPGHCLAAGIVTKELAGPTADRLMQDDLFSGWGVRTLSTQNPAFNPYSYHRGSVWPVEQATFVLGLVRFGLHGHADRLSRAVFDAARLFDSYRLPELFAGHARDADHPFPALYPQANSPQAWSASATLQIVQALLGLFPYAPLGVLFVDPHLPAWLPELTVSDLRVGSARVSLRFFRTEDGSTDYRVIDLEGRLRVVRQPSPWSLTAGVGERLGDLLKSAAPSRRRGASQKP
jgi:glycogen debranching enzyme